MPCAAKMIREHICVQTKSSHHHPRHKHRKGTQIGQTIFLPSVDPPLLTPPIKHFSHRTRNPDHNVGLICPKTQQWERARERP